MSKVGRFVTDPTVGVYCHVTLSDGDKILVSHDTRSLASGHLAVERSKWLGLGSDRIFSLDLSSAEGRAALRHLTADAEPGSTPATPLGALVEYIKDCRNADELSRRLDALIAAARAAA